MHGALCFTGVYVCVHAVWNKGFFCTTGPWLKLHKHTVLCYMYFHVCSLGLPTCVSVCVCVSSCSLFIRRDLSSSSACLCPGGAQLSPQAGADFRPPAFCQTPLSLPLCPLATIHQTSAAPNANPTPDSFFKQPHQCCRGGCILNFIMILEERIVTS